MNRSAATCAAVAGVAASGCGRLSFSELVSTQPDASIADAALAIPAGCAMYLALDEPMWNGTPGEVRDRCGTNHGTALNGAVPAIDATRGQVGQFVGGTSCIIVPDASALHMAKQLTASAWIRPVALSPLSFGVISKRRDFQVDTEYSVFVWASGNGSGPVNHVYVDIDTENDRIDDPNATYLDGWRQITVVYDGGLPQAQRTAFYVDGVLSFAAPETSTDVTIPLDPAPLAVGCLPLSGPAQAMEGMIDDVVLWSRALSATEVGDWYNATRR